MIRTVLGDIHPEALGVTLSHEHLFGQPPSEYAEADLCLTDESLAAAELGLFRAVGGGGVVEMSTVDYGRNVGVLRRLSKASGVHITAATGFNKAKFADRYTATLSEADLTAWIVTEVEQGISEPPWFVAGQAKPVPARAGVIKASTSLNGPTEAEEKVMRAVAQAHVLTGAPVATHTEKGTWALEQATFLIGQGVQPSKLLIGHLDFRPDPAYLSEIASLGVYLGLDQFSKSKYLSDDARIDLVLELSARGFERQLLLSGDLARKTYWCARGGSGFAYLVSTIWSRLSEAGMTQQHLERLFFNNPSQWLTF